MIGKEQFDLGSAQTAKPSSFRPRQVDIVVAVDDLDRRLKGVFCVDPGLRAGTGKRISSTDFNFGRIIRERSP